MDFSYNRRTPLFLALMLGLSLGTAGCMNQGGKTEESGKVVATVNDESITEDELKAYGEARPAQAGRASEKALLDELVSREVVYQDALRKKLDEDPEIQRKIEQSRTRVLVSAAVRKAMEESPITDEVLQGEYDKLKDRMVSSEYKARHILVDEEDLAKELIAKLDGGADFAELAKEHSTGPSGKKGGDLGWFNPKQMVPAFSKAAGELEKGTYTKAPVKTRFGYHVIKLEDKRQSEAPPFEKVKPRLTQMVKQRKAQEYIQGLKEDAKIEIKEDEADAESSAGDDQADAMENPDTENEEKAETSTEE